MDDKVGTIEEVALGQVGMAKDEVVIVDEAKVADIVVNEERATEMYIGIVDMALSSNAITLEPLV